MSSDINKSNLTRTKISNCKDTLDIRNYILSLNMTKHQTYIDNKTAPNLLSRTPAPPPPSPTTNIMGVRKWWISNKLTWKWSKSNETRITACNTQKSENKIPLNKLVFIIGDSMVKYADGYQSWYLRPTRCNKWHYIKRYTWINCRRYFWHSQLFKDLQ